MKYLVFWEFEFKAIDALIEKFRTPSEDEPKILFPQHCILGQTKTVAVYETEDEAEIQKLCAFVAPDARAKVLPLIELRKSVEMWEKMK